MKRIITAVALLVSVTFIAKADERPIEVNSMPKAAVEFISTHFAQVPVLLATVDRELMDTDYEVRFEDGTKIDFDGKGRWIEVSNKRVGVPVSVIPKSIATYLTDKYPTAKCLSIERNLHSYEVNLTNGLELIFSLDGRLVGYDD